MNVNLIIISFIIGLIASYIANLLVPQKVMRHVQSFWSRRILLKFWGEQNRRSIKFWEKPKEKKAYIYYPSYPSPRVGRTENPLGYYVSAADVKAVELLEETLSDLGFKCERLTADEIDTKQPFPNDGGIIILVCGPKLDTTTNQVVYDPWIGGNPASSKFYLSHRKKMRMTLSYDRNRRRKEYEVYEAGGVYEQTESNIDKGLLVKIKLEGRLFFLCWGIHDTATLGAVNVALDPIRLAKSGLLKSSNFIAVVNASKTDGMSWGTNTTEHWYPLIDRDERYDEWYIDMKPDPFKLKQMLPPETPVYGLSYLWATTDNVRRVKEGNYQKLAPVAAEFDTSLCCPYNCSWCPYKGDRTEDVLNDDKIALKIVDKLKESGVKLVVLTGGGEPLMSKCAEAVVESCRQHEIKVILYTNGLLLNDLRAYHLMSRGISEIRISLDDISDLNNYMAVHGIKGSKIKDYLKVRDLNEDQNVMEVIEENTRQLLGLRARNGFSTIIGASFLVSNSTFPNLIRSAETLSKWLHKVGPFDYVVIRPAVKYWPGGEPHNAYFSGVADFTVLEKAAQHFKEQGVARHIFISRQRFDDLQEKSTEAYSVCRASILWLNIGPDGRAYLCCETKHKRDFLLGNILTTPLADLQKSAFDKISNPVVFDSCPLHLCKPSALNQLFDDIESYRTNHVLPKAICDWLDKLEAHNQNAETLIPSVSGIYEEYNEEYLIPSK